MAHPLRGFSPPVWNSADARAIVSLLYSLAQVSRRVPLPSTRDLVFSVPDKFLPAAFERRRSLVLPAKPAALSRHPPSCPAGDRFLRATGAPRHCPHLLRARRGIPSQQPLRAPRTAPAARAECAPRAYRPIPRPRVHPLELRAI